MNKQIFLIIVIKNDAQIKEDSNENKKKIFKKCYTPEYSIQSSRR